ncbi:MAG: polyprenol monophosphomannose synthase [Candidatus Omnitrophica bacterium]|nr:polyprenol monophosphomannose synthase [Candidatus Omnitrophota bacterium]
MKTVIFLPIYNEKENIRPLVSEILKLIPDLYILAVDDSSDDGTAQLLDEIAKGEQRLRVVHRTGKRGRGISGIEGFKRALIEKPDYIIEMDADFSHDPKYIPVFLREIEDCDVVIGSRTVKGGGVFKRAYLRNYISAFAQFFSRMVLGLKISDATSGFRCFRRRVLESLDWGAMISRGPAIVEEMNYRIQKKGFKIKEVPIVFGPRKSGRSKLNFLKLAAVFYTLIRIRMSDA